MVTRVHFWTRVTISNNYWRWIKLFQNLNDDQIQIITWYLYSNIKNLKCNIYCCYALEPHQCTSLVHSVHLGPFGLLQPISVHFALFGLYIKKLVTPKFGGLFKTPHPPRKIYYWHRRVLKMGWVVVCNNETVLPTLWQCSPSRGG